jgi:hypothetical protein
MALKQFIMKIRFITSLMIFIWYHKYWYFCLSIISQTYLYLIFLIIKRQNFRLFFFVHRSLTNFVNVKNCFSSCLSIALTFYIYSHNITRSPNPNIRCSDRIPSLFWKLRPHASYTNRTRSTLRSCLACIRVEVQQR